MGRVPVYLDYLKTCHDAEYISAVSVAQALHYGEVTVRKDLGILSGQGRPRLGFQRQALIRDLEQALGLDRLEPVVLVGAGKLGQALFNYPGFLRFGFSIRAAFDDDPQKQCPNTERPVLPMPELAPYCRENGVKIGILTVPEVAAQRVCNEMVAAGMTEIWSFAPCRLAVPTHVHIQQENLALSIAYLHMSAKRA